MKFEWTKLAAIALAGGLGTLARYGLSSWVSKLSPSQFPWGTFAVNALGCFLFGLLWAFAEYRSMMSEQMRIILLVGFMGAFTTFSTFAFDTGEFLRNGQYGFAAANIGLQNVIGCVFVLLGIMLAKMGTAGQGI